MKLVCGRFNPLRFALSPFKTHLSKLRGGVWRKRRWDADSNGLPKSDVCYWMIPSPPGEGGATAPGEGSPPHDLVRCLDRDRGAGCPHPALPRHLLPKGEGLLRILDSSAFKKGTLQANK
jgi:hypothetical protein